MIRLEDVSFTYRDAPDPLFQGLSLAFAPSSRTVVTGPDGAGKSTLARLIKGLIKPSQGVVCYDGPEEGAPGRIGYIGADPQDSLVGISVEDDVVFGLENLRLPPDEMAVRVRRVLVWTGLAGTERRLVGTLSGGEQQKLVLASVLAMGARTLVLDEALAMLDRSAGSRIRSLLATLRRDLGLTVIEVTNDPAEIRAAERVLFLSAGRVVFDGSGASFAASPHAREWLGLSRGLPGLRHALQERGMHLDGHLPGGSPRSPHPLSQTSIVSD